MTCRSAGRYWSSKDRPYSSVPHGGAAEAASSSVPALRRWAPRCSPAARRAREPVEASSASSRSHWLLISIERITLSQVLERGVGTPHERAEVAVPQKTERTGVGRE